MKQENREQEQRQNKTEPFELNNLWHFEIGKYIFII